MSVREKDDPSPYYKIQEQNLLRQYDLLSNCIEIGLKKDIEAFDKYTLWALNYAKRAGNPVRFVIVWANMTDQKIDISSADFDKIEGAVLNALYERANGTYSSYALYLVIHPDVQPGTQPAEEAFVSVRDATERLIASDLVKGERLNGADGVYFDVLKLTDKGERAAIKERNRVKAVIIPHIPGVREADPPPPPPTKPSWK
jgi:hypothetical protein